MKLSRQKARTRLLIFFLILSSLIIQSCKTTEQVRPVLPPRPQREYIGQLGTIKDYVLVIAYYEFLVEEWETWGETVSAMIDE